ncbi:MAG: efflux RND transporter periplasmic adaptor subunit [Burkholderiaceae bacterium]
MSIPDLSDILRKHRGVIIGLVIALLGALYLIAHALFGVKVYTYTVTRSDITQTVVASGHVETPLRINIGSQVTGTVASIPVAEGQIVKAGQLLIALENSEAKAAEAQALAAVTQAQTRLRQLQEVSLPTAQQGLHQAQINLQNVQRQYDRTKELRSKGFVGQSQLDDAQHNLDLAESQLRTAQLQVTTNSVQGSDYQMAKAALAQAQANLNMARARLEYTTIEAPVDGTLIARDVERGAVVQPGKALMVLSPTGQTQLILQIDEKNLAFLHLGQQALASADAYPDQRFRAEVAYINPAVDPQRGSVEVKLNVPNAPAYLRQDMTVSVDIEVAHHADAIVAPAATVHDGSSTAPWVMLVNHGRAHRRTIKLGVRGSSMVEILEGIQPGDSLISSNTANIADGQRVHARTLPQDKKSRK